MHASSVVVGVDGSLSSQRAVRWAAREASLRGARLTLMSTELFSSTRHDESMGVFPNMLDCQRDTRTALLTDAAQLVDDTVVGGALDVDIVGSAAAPFVTLLEQSVSAQMIVVGAHGAGGNVGPVARWVSAHAACPAVVVRARAEQRLLGGPVVLGVGNADAVTVRAAFAEAAIREVDLIAVHAWNPQHGAPPSDESADWMAELDEYSLLAMHLDEQQHRFPHVTTRHIIVHDTPERGLLEQTPRSQLLVVGRRTGRRFAALHRTLSRSLLRHSDRPVMIVPHR